MHTRCLHVVFACLLLALTGTAAAQFDGPDILIQNGTVVATATDYEMDGTMWTAVTKLEDTCTFLYRSTDHGLSWEYRMALRLGNAVAEKLGLVAGEGDSAFIYVFCLDPQGNGDLWSMRVSRDGSSMIGFPVAVGPDTIRDFAVCRDYTGGNYWLYAVATNPDPPVGGRSVRFLRSSTYGREWYVTDSAQHRALDPHLSAGPGSYIFCAFTHGDTLTLRSNRLYLSSGYWNSAFYYSGYEVADPVIAAAFTLPESTATVWALWAENYQNSGDWDIVYCCATDGGRNWFAPDYLAGSRTAIERFPDLRNYTSLGNQYINASYISELEPDRRVYRHYANAANPGGWSDTLRINEGNAGTGPEIRPKLCYTPGGPFSGAGCVFVGAGLNGCWWNGPYPTDLAEPPGRAAEVTRLFVQPSVGYGPFRIRVTSPAAMSIRDRAGRLVRDLALNVTGDVVWDGCDATGRRVPAGVYFIHAGVAPQPTKVVLTR